MTRSLRGVLFAGALLTLASPAGQAAQDAPQRLDHGKAEPRLKGYSTPPGFKLEIVPTPTLTRPVTFSFTPAGVPIVLEPAAGKVAVKTDGATITYKDGSTRKIAVAGRSGPDTIQLLRSTKEDGPWDKTETALKAANLGAVLAADDWLYTATPGQIERVKASTPEAKAETIARGFAHVPNGVTGLAIGPDHWLYVAVGAGDHHVEGSDGSKAIVPGTGAIFRCKPDGSRLHLVAQGLAQPTAPTWDSVGQAFFADRQPEKGRVLHLLEGSDYGYTLPSRRANPVPEALRKELLPPLPSLAPTLVRTAGSAPGAILSPAEARWPGHYRALLLVADPARHAITALGLIPEGATFSVERSFDLLLSEDKSFNPVALSVGPDGAVYLLDGRPESRLLRLTWAGTEMDEALPPRSLDTWQKLLKASDEDLLAALTTPEASDRRLAGAELGRRGPKQLPGLLKLAKNNDEPVLARLAALSAALPLWDDDVRKTCLSLTRTSENDLRRQVVQALGLYAAPRDLGVQNVLIKILDDGDLTVRRAVAVTMGRLAAPGAVDALANTLTFDEGRHPAWVQGLVHGIDLLGKPGIDRLISVADSGVETEIAKIVQAFTALHARPAIEALPKLLLNPHLTARQRTLLLRTIPHYRFDPPISLDFIAAHFEAMPDEPAEVKLAALEGVALSTSATSPKLTAWLVSLLGDKDARVGPVALLTLAGKDLASARKALAGLTAETRAKWLSELKKRGDVGDALRQLEK